MPNVRRAGDRKKTRSPNLVEVSGTALESVSCRRAEAAVFWIISHM